MRNALKARFDFAESSADEIKKFPHVSIHKEEEEEALIIIIMGKMNELGILRVVVHIACAALHLSARRV